MLKFFNKIKFVLLGYALISAYVFAQGTDTWTLDNSAVKRATAGQFSTDSDKIKSKDIFDLQRSFLTAGYLGGGSFSATGNGTDDALANGINKLNNVVQGAFGIALPNNMYLGFAAKYKFDDGANITKDKDGNTPNSLSANQYTINSQAAMRVAFRINEMAALHYYLEFGPSVAGSSVYSIDKVIQKADKTDYSIINNNGTWKHEIAASIKLGEHKLTIPVGIVFNANNTKYKGKIGDTKIDYVNYIGEDYISLYLNPEFNLGIAAGPMTGITVGANIGFGVNNNFGENGTSMNDPTTKVESKQGKDRFAGDLYVSFPLKWSLADDRVQLAMEPKASLGLAVTNTGNTYIKEGNTPSYGTAGYKSEVKFTPYAELPIGTTWRPVEWWELRAGTALMIQAVTTWTTDIPTKTGNPQELDEANKTVNTDFTTRAGIAGFFGMGFIVGEDFNIDLFAEVNKLNISTLSFGGQLTYRFN